MNRTTTLRRTRLTTPVTTPLTIAAITLAIGATGGVATASPECTHLDGDVPFGLMGDVNGSGTRNVADALCATMAALASLATAEGEPPWPSCVQVAPLLLDLNCDGDVNMSDVQLVVWLATTGSLPTAVASGQSGCPDSCEPSSGQSQEAAGLSCKAILDAGHSVGDGIYWIDPNGGSTDDAFEAYCDMTTDGGGWTRIPYAASLPFQQQFTGGDAWRWLPTDFELALTADQIDDLHAISTQGRQTYVGLCEHVIHYYFNGGSNYGYAFGFRFYDGAESPSGQQSYAPFDIEVVQDGCATNGGEGGLLQNATVFDISYHRVPVVNVRSRDSGDGGEHFGSPLLDNPAWVR